MALPTYVPKYSPKSLNSGEKSKLPDTDQEMAIFNFLLRVTQLMEDVWVLHDLDQYWSHPLNEGWMAWSNRWASTDSFRRWWPVLAPIYSLRFREFAKQRFGVGVKDTSARGESERPIKAGELTLSNNSKILISNNSWRARRGKPPPNLSQMHYSSGTKTRRVFQDHNRFLQIHSRSRSATMAT